MRTHVQEEAADRVIDEHERTTTFIIDWIWPQQQHQQQRQHQQQQHQQQRQHQQQQHQQQQHQQHILAIHYDKAGTEPRYQGKVAFLKLVFKGKLFIQTKIILAICVTLRQ